MQRHARQETLPGLGPGDDERTEGDIFEVDGVTKRATVLCPRPGSQAPVSGFGPRYSLPSLVDALDDVAVEEGPDAAPSTTSVRVRDTIPDDFDPEGPTPFTGSFWSRSRVAS
jgi:hypothetical protein